jgi:thymidylate synthase
VLAREPRKLPIIKIPDDVNLWNWTCKDFEISEYNPHSFVSAPIAI